MFAKRSISRIFSFLFIIVFILTIAPPPAVHAAGVRYAKPAASGSGDCSTWGNACSLQTALTGAASGDEIWAAAGTYKPTTNPADRGATFQLLNGVALYGGFAGTETRRSERNPAVHATILSGDLNGDDAGFANNSENSYHVVTGSGTDSTAILDGFTITAGNATAGTVCPGTFCGGGMLNDGGNPTLTNVVISGNSASYGGGMANWGSSPTLTNVTFSGNTASVDAGGMYNVSDSNPPLTDVTFSGNSAGNEGGGMHNRGLHSTITNVTFIGNSAAYGGGMYNSGSTPWMVNVTFSENSAANFGGGMYIDNFSVPSFRDTIFWGNTSPGIGKQIYAQSGGANAYDSIVQGGCADNSWTCDPDIITADPKLGTLGNYGGFTQTIPLLPGSSAIDTGNDATCAVTDQRGVPRPQGEHCDIGAYELDTTAPIVNSITLVNSSPTNLASVDFTVTFSEPVTGVEVSDFDLTITGVSGASVTGVNGSDSVYTVTVNTGSGNGSIRLDVPASGVTITDLALNLLAGLPYTGGQTYMVIKTYFIYLPLVMR